LVDDHPVVREGMAQRVNREPDLAVCGEAQMVEHALHSIVELRPDIVVLDLSLPDGHGLELIKDLKAIDAGLRVLVFTMHEESLFAERALRAGARGYVMKQEPPERLLDGIRAVLRGDYFVSGKATSAFLESFFSQPKNATGSAVGRFTDRELEVFQLIGRGKSTRAIAGQLHRSVKTIETYRARLMKKLSISTAAELVCRASQRTDAGP
jgi:DNA-binding NarL/FixJ family response regulator